MNEVALILKQQRIPFKEENGELVFPTCPLCQDRGETAVLGSEGFFCAVCTIKSIGLRPFFAALHIGFDDSDIDFSQLFASNVDEVFDPNRMHGLESGYPLLDKKTGGLRQAHLYILAAETGMGKSVFAINLMINLVKQRAACSYFDLENGRFASMTRFVTVQSGESVDLFRASATPMLGEMQEKKEKALTAAQALKDKLFYRDHVKLQPFISSSEGEAMAKAIGELIKADVVKRGVRVVVIDPLENFELGESDYNAISKVVLYFKDLAQELKIAIMILHHVRKPERVGSKLVKDVTVVEAPKYRIPTLYDILGSSKITNIATDVWALVRQKSAPEESDRGKTLIRILKQREGSELGDVLLHMNEKNLRMVEMETRYEQ